ncbi:MAG TPA: 16S rRNA (guanine(527)-N(7))-methyltransferase RsmG [Blastocatellia bacterium]|nr:16S rRNA (guanine(527)-N(7))-methyltransferase RsmG [Blastocatellia bacterium]
MSTDEDNNFRRAFETAVAGYSLQAFSEHQITQLVNHYSMLRRWNRRMNLTRIIEPEEAARLHYAESLSGARFIGEAASLLDIGSGAGFPAVPLAVARPDVRVVALEANQKKSLFLREVKDDLHLDNFSVANARLESFDWSGYELLTSRALDRAETILPSVVEHLAARQRLMLFCAPELVRVIEASLGSRVAVETHPLSRSDSRLIAIFSCAVA